MCYLYATIFHSLVRERDGLVGRAFLIAISSRARR